MMTLNTKKEKSLLVEYFAAVWALPFIIYAVVFGLILCIVALLAIVVMLGIPLAVGLILTVLFTAVTKPFRWVWNKYMEGVSPLFR